MDGCPALAMCASSGIPLHWMRWSGGDRLFPRREKHRLQQKPSSFLAGEVFVGRIELSAAVTRKTHAQDSAFRRRRSTAVRVIVVANHASRWVEAGSQSQARARALNLARVLRLDAI